MTEIKDQIINEIIEGSGIDVNRLLQDYQDKRKTFEQLSNLEKLCLVKYREGKVIEEAKEEFAEEVGKDVYGFVVVEDPSREDLIKFYAAKCNESAVLHVDASAVTSVQPIEKVEQRGGKDDNIALLEEPRAEKVFPDLGCNCIIS